MAIGSQTKKRLQAAVKKAQAAQKSVFKGSKLAVAGVMAAGLAALNSGKQAFSAAMDFKEEVLQKNKKTKGEISMKKSTFVTLLVVFAAIAGALGALYFYVLRREKELDEYEQLLFSEDFNDEIPAEYTEDVAEDVVEEKPAKATKAKAKA
ncbi:hypothetical protein LJC61_05490 [Ruminococcaceae bacterium OttesenSCG-928-A16]|nr:hypothetical protein [Ruminococcaceae bacterium OttesenSCG-928-A16]